MVNSAGCSLLTKFKHYQQFDHTRDISNKQDNKDKERSARLSAREYHARVLEEIRADSAIVA